MDHRSLLALSSLLTAPLFLSCASRCPPCAEAPLSPTPHLVGQPGAWKVSGLTALEAQLFQRGDIMAALVPDVADHHPGVLLQVVSPGSPGGQSIQVAPLCSERGGDGAQRSMEQGLEVIPLSARTETRIGTCLAQIVDEGKDKRGAYVTLDIGGHNGVRPHDIFRILGRPVFGSAFIPLGFDAGRDGRCVIPEQAWDLKGLTARCDIIAEPDLGGRPLTGSMVVYQPVEDEPTP